jgi:predicted choloylglycine hydrolase
MLKTGQIKYVECKGTPRQMGQQYGEAAREEIQQDLHQRMQYLDYGRLAGLKRRVVGVMQRYVPEVLKELYGVAEGANVKPELIMFANHVDTFDDEVERCTPVIVRSAKDGVLIAKNNDAGINETNPFVIRKCTPDVGIPTIQITYAGFLSGLDMMNAEGVANTHGSVGSIFAKAGNRIDIKLYLYHLMRVCKSLAEIIEGLRSVPLTGKGFSIAVGDAGKETAFLDAAVPEIGVRDRNRDYDYSTNLYRASGLEHADLRSEDRRQICRNRSEYLKGRDVRSLSQLKELLSDHQSPWAPCRHGRESGSKTTWSVVALTEQNKFLVAAGHPCSNPYEEYVI